MKILGIRDILIIVHVVCNAINLYKIGVGVFEDQRWIYVT